MSVPDDSAAKQQLNLEGGEALIKQALAELGLVIDGDMETRSKKGLSRKKTHSTPDLTKKGCK